MSIFAEPALLVPIHVDALAVGEQPREESFQWTRSTPAFEKLEDDFFLGPKLAGDPFDQAPPLPSGVHLHFRLPHAFAQGRQKAGSPLTFPSIPNRWLVLRIVLDGGPRASHQAWLIRSDQRVSADGVAWPDFADGAVSVIHIGAAEELNAPPVAEDDDSDLQLTAVGVARREAKTQTADLLFSAHYYACRTVLGFHDELADVTAGAQLSYLVTGWFSRREDDPLWLATREPDPARWQDLETWLKDRKWTCAEAEQELAPCRVLCHGFTRGLRWNGADHDYFHPLLNTLRTSRRPPGAAETLPDAAVAETPAEALAALLRSREVEQDLLTALQEGLLEEGITIAKLRCDLHSRRFDAAQGGATYVLAAEAELVADQNQAPRTTPAVPPELARRLSELNGRQEEFDRVARRFQDCRQQLYSTWFLLTAESQQGEDDRKIAALSQQLDADRNEFANAAQELEKAALARDALLSAAADDQQIWTESDPGETARFRLTQTPAAAFHMPSDPAIALAGPIVARWGTAERATIECRPEARVLRSISFPVPGANEVVVTGEQAVNDLFGAAPAALDALHLSLLGEALLYDRSNADRIAGIAKVRKGTTGRLVGRVPDSIALFDRSGENPWIPLALAWEVQWQPDRDSGATNPASANAVTNRWSIGEDGELSAGAGTTDVRGAYRICGQTLLLSGALAKLRDHLKGAVETASLASELANQSAAVQSFAGLNAALIRRRLGTLLPALDWSGYSTGKGLRVDAIHKELAADETALRFAPERREEFPPFQPVRAGNLKIVRLSIIDAFGQTFRLKMSDTPAANFKLRTAHSCRGEADEEIVLRPRLLQPARLGLDWVDPICGWIVPNHIDQSFTLHDADGQALGLFQKRMEQRAGTDDLAAFYCAAVPGGSTTADRIQDPHLRAFRTWALGLDPDAGAMLFSLISEQIDAADRRAPEADGLLSIVIGRPLALARASLRLELAGPPMHAPDARDTRGLESVRWPIRLGDRRAADDGLIGFFVPTGTGLDQPVRFDKDAFFPAWRPTMTPMSHGLKRRFPDQAERAIDAVQPLPILVLMDPEAVLRVASGVLPVATFRLPSAASESRRRARDAFVLTAPVLGFADEPEMPRPSDDYGEWSWLWRPSVSAWKAADHLVEAAERGGFDDRWPRISEGWLKLRIEPLKLLSFWIQDADKPVERGSRPRLAWAQQGAERLELSTVSPQPKSVRVWDKPPFPSAYAVEVHEQTTFELKASAGGMQRSLQLVVQVQ